MGREGYVDDSRMTRGKKLFVVMKSDVRVREMK